MLWFVSSLERPSHGTEGGWDVPSTEKWKSTEPLTLPLAFRVTPQFQPLNFRPVAGQFDERIIRQDPYETLAGLGKKLGR